jgi:hypothetical protein
LAGATGFEPAIFGLTGRHVKPLHHAPITVLIILRTVFLSNLVLIALQALLIAYPQKFSCHKNRPALDVFPR